MDYQKVGQFIKNKRLAKNLTQQELADSLFIDVTAVSKWERGKTFPDNGIVTRLCTKLGISEHELFQACEDEEYRNAVTKISKLKKGKRIFTGVSLGLYILTLFICLLTNIITDHTVSWFFIVFTALLTGFTFMPTVIVFVKEYKIFWFAISTFLSQSIMYLTISIYVSNYWCFIAISAVLLFYFMFFSPFMFFKYDIFKKVRKLFLLFYSTISYVLLLVMLIVINCQYRINMSFSISLISYLTIPFIICGFLNIFNIPGLLKSSLFIFVGSSFLIGLNGFLNFFLDKEAFKYCYMIDFTNWDKYNNGNVCFIFGILALLSCALLMLLFVKKIIQNKHNDMNV